MKKYKILPYFQWQYYRSWRKDSPNILKFKVIDELPFNATFATTVKVSFYNKGIWYKMNLPLWNYTTSNKELLEEWEKNLINGKIKQRRQFLLKTWKERTQTGNTLRRYILEF